MRRSPFFVDLLMPPAATNTSRSAVDGGNCARVLRKESKTLFRSVAPKMVWQNIVILCVRDVAAAVVPSLRLSQDVNCCKVFFGRNWFIVSRNQLLGHWSVVLAVNPRMCILVLLPCMVNGFTRMLWWTRCWTTLPLIRNNL